MKTREELIEKYKDLFDGPHAYPSCGNGWLSLIESFCERVTNDIQYNDMPSVKITQIKEKFGRLCIYHQGGNDFSLAYELFASTMSYYVCEVCGTTHNIGHTTGWIKTICKDCNEAWENSPAATVRAKREWANY